MDFEEEGATFDLVQVEPSQSQPVSQTLSQSPSPAVSPAVSLAPSQPVSRAVSPAPSQPVSRAVSPAPSQPVSRAVSPAPSQPVSRAVSPAPSQPVSWAVSPAPSQPVSRAPSQPVSQILSPGPSQPVSQTLSHKFPTPSHSISPRTFPIHSLSKKRKGDSLMSDAPKRVQTIQPTTTRRSTRSKTSSACQLPEPIAQTHKTRPSRRHGSSPTLPPAWFSNSLAMLQSNEPPLGNRWAELLRLWSAFEEMENYTERQKLSPDGRPLCVSEWIRRGRSTTWRPVISSIPALEKSFEEWWTNLQPDWRKNDDGSIVFASVDGDWEILRKPGLNGILSAIACLFYWGCKVQGNMTRRARWATSVEDCILVLHNIVLL